MEVKVNSPTCGLFLISLVNTIFVMLDIDVLLLLMNCSKHLVTYIFHLTT